MPMPIGRGSSIKPCLSGSSSGQRGGASEGPQEVPLQAQVAESGCHDDPSLAQRLRLGGLSFDWAVYQKTKGAVKLHMVLDHDGYLPRFAVITDGKTSEITVARQQQYEPGTMLVFDKGYTDHRWFLELSRQRVHFVTRLNDDASYGLIVKQDNPRFVDQSTRSLSEIRISTDRTSP